MTTNVARKKDRWGSQLGVILAVSGSAVGLGNFLRFPGQVVNNGGGAFMIPYVVSLLVVAIPLATAEWALGRYGGRRGYHSPAGVYYSATNRSAFWGAMGSLATVAPFIIGMYYVFIEAWCLVYAAQYLGGVLAPFGLGFTVVPNSPSGLLFDDAQGYENFFGSLVGIGKNGALFSFGTSTALFATLACAGVNFLLLYRGVSRGIERFCKAAAPLILLCSIAVIIRVISLGNPTGQPGQSFLDGLGFMWNPTREVATKSGELVRVGVWETLANPDVWLAATSQIFFSVSICLGAVCTYASYVKPRGDVALSSLAATATNEFCEVGFGGLMSIPPAIMFLGARASGSFASSFALGFVVLPNVFGLMPFGQFWGFLFFFLLLLAAVTSSVSMIQPMIALLQESQGWTRERSAGVASTVNFVGTLVICAYTLNLGALDVFDFWVANFLPLVTAIIQTIVVCFVWGASALRSEIARGSRIKPPLFLVDVVKYVSFPYMILVVLFWGCRNMGTRIHEIARSPVAQISLVFMSIVGIATFALATRAARRWRQIAETDAVEG